MASDQVTDMSSLYWSCVRLAWVVCYRASNREGIRLFAFALGDQNDGCGLRFTARAEVVINDVQGDGAMVMNGDDSFLARSRLCNAPAVIANLVIISPMAAWSWIKVWMKH